MREIKFRHYSTTFGMTDNPTMLAGEQHINETLNGMDGFFMQYTGLKDKNGVEIYEGDIVSNDNNKYEVLFLNSMWAFKKCGQFNQPLNKITISGYELSVIGNIHENPELMESK